MVELMNSRRLCRKVKLEMERKEKDEQQHSQGQLNNNKKLKHCPQTETGSSSSIPIDEPSPLGLRLRKTPSLLDLIQIRLSAHPNLFTPGPPAAHTQIHDSAADKLKASNFPASLLRIGSWEYVSRHEGDLVAKCYFAKHKLVWEVLWGGLKSKIEIQWSDITALKVNNYSDDAPGTLDIVLARRPLFFRETNPQPRKHTLWQATSDFTGGQASLHRRHFLQCQHGLLSKHFEKLIQCDPRLNLLSRQPEIILKSPHFELKGSVFEEDPDESKCNNYVSSFGYHDASAALPCLSINKIREAVDRAPEHLSRENGGSCEAEESKAVAVEGRRGELNMSTSTSDLVSRICEQVTGEGLQHGDMMMEEVTQYLLSDSNQLASTSDEKSVMARVNSLSCLLQKNPPPPNERYEDDYRITTGGSKSKNVSCECKQL